MRRSRWPLGLLAAAVAAGAAGALAAGNCSAVLAASCSTDRSRAHSPFASQTCAVCAGQRQHELRAAGCSHADIEEYCSDDGAASTVWVSSAQGDDSRDGTSADNALRTIAAALPLVRKLKAAALLLDGQFRLAEPLTLNAPLAGLRVDKWPGRPAPVLSGAQALPSGSWQPVRSGDFGGVFRAPLTPAQAAALDGAGAVIVGGKKFSPLRTPTQHWNTSLGGTRNAPENVLGFVYGEGTIDPSWSLAPESLARWTVAAFHSWNKAYHKVKAVFPHNRTILFETPAKFGYGDYEYCSEGRFYVEGVPEMKLVDKGSWRSTATELYFAPEDAGKPIEAEVPVAETLVQIYASDVELSNLVIENTAGVLGCGAASTQRNGPGACDADLAEMAAGAIAIGGQSSRVKITNLTMQRVGGYAIRAAHAPHLQIERSAFIDSGAGAVLITSADFAFVSNCWVRGFGQRYPAGVGIAVTSSRNGTVSHCDVSEGLYNGLIFGGTHDAGAYSRYEFNHVHDNGHESDDGICDFGAIHGSNAGSLLPIWITSNIFHGITAFQNGGSGVYMDVSSTGVQVERNLVYDVSAETVNWNVNPGVPALPYPWPEGAAPTRLVNNVLIAERDNEYGKTKAAHGRGNTNAAIDWTGYTPAQFERNVVVVDSSSAPSRDGWFGGRPCAMDKLPPGKASPHCTWDLSDNMFGDTIARNVYFNRTTAANGRPIGQMTATFPGGCAATARGECGVQPGANRTAFNGGCSCRSFEAWQGSGKDGSSLVLDPKLDDSPLKLVTASEALALGIEPLRELATVGPDWGAAQYGPPPPPPPGWKCSPSTAPWQPGGCWPDPAGGFKSELECDQQCWLNQIPKGGVAERRQGGK